MSKFNYRLNYGTQFGGVVALTRHQLLHVNGFSNRFWGWGGEDNEIERRVYQSGLGREGADPSLGRFTMLTHEHSWSFDPKREIVISTADTVFREIRLKYAYTRDDELGMAYTIHGKHRKIFQESTAYLARVQFLDIIHFLDGCIHSLNAL